MICYLIDIEVNNAHFKMLDNNKYQTILSSSSVVMCKFLTVEQSFI